MYSRRHVIASDCGLGGERWVVSVCDTCEGRGSGRGACTAPAANKRMACITMHGTVASDEHTEQLLRLTMVL